MGIRRVLSSAALATLLGLVAFTNRATFLGAVGGVSLGWLAVLGAWALVGRRAPRWRPGAGAALASFAIGAGSALLTSHSRKLLLCCLGQMLLVWTPTLAVLSLPGLLRRWRDVLALVASTGLCALVLWLAGPRLMSSYLLPYHTLNLDHRPRPFLRGANEDGIYSRRTPAEFAAGDFNVVCLGDSFTANLQVPRHQRYPEVLEEILRARHPERRIRVANFGWESSSPILQLRQLRDIGARYHPALVVQGFDMTDFHDDLRYAARLRKVGAEGTDEMSVFRALAVRVGVALGVDDYGAWLGARLAWRPRERDGIPSQRYFFLYQALDDSEPLFTTSWQAILDTEAEARRLGARYALVVFPRYQQYDRRESPDDWEKDRLPSSDEFVLEPFKYFEARARVAPFPIHSLLPDFRASDAFPKCLRSDPHWTAAGNRIAAEAIARYLEADGFLSERPGR